MHPFVTWQVIAPGSLHTRAWENEVVVYEATSGNTHLLDATAARILATIATAPADAAAIAQTLADLWRDIPAEQMHERVDAILAELADISLIMPVKP